MISFEPGPSQLLPSVQQYYDQAFAQNIGSMSHRSQAFKDIVQSTTQSLRKLLSIPESHHMFFLGSATEAMERIIQNTVKEYSFHLVNGAFSDRFFQIAQDMQKKPVNHEVAWGQSFDTVPIPADTELICVTQNETSTGVMIPGQELIKIKQQFPRALLAVDVVSATPCLPLDISKVDCAFFSVQKCFGMPPGLGVLIVSQQAMDTATQAQKLQYRGSFHSFASLAKKAAEHQTVETPNMIAIYVLGKVCEAFLAKGIDTIQKETQEKAALLYDFFDNHASMNPFVTNKDARSPTVLAITADNPSAIREQAQSKGFKLGAGYGKLKPSQFRIANFPATSVEDVKNLIHALSTMN